MKIEISTSTSSAEVYKSLITKDMLEGYYDICFKSKYDGDNKIIKVKILDIGLTVSANSDKFAILSIGCDDGKFITIRYYSKLFMVEVMDSKNFTAESFSFEKVYVN